MTVQLRPGSRLGPAGAIAAQGTADPPPPDDGGAARAAFDEAKHPRGYHGKFAHVPGTTTGRMAQRPELPELAGNALWGSPNGTCEPTPDEIEATARVWYSEKAIVTNMRLRGKAADLPADPQFAHDEAIFEHLIGRSAPFTQPGLMYRGADGGEAIFGPPGSMVGKTFTDAGFVSLSAKYDTAQQYGDTMMRVHVQAGIHAFHAHQGIWARAGNPSYYTVDGIREYTLPPGSRFQINEDRPAQPGIPRTVDVTVLPPASVAAAAAAVVAAAKTPGPAGPEPAEPGGLPGGQRFGWQPGDIEFDPDDEDTSEPEGGQHG